MFWYVCDTDHFLSQQWLTDYHTGWLGGRAASQSQQGMHISTGFPLLHVSVRHIWPQGNNALFLQTPGHGSTINCQDIATGQMVVLL